LLCAIEEGFTCGDVHCFGLLFVVCCLSLDGS
jgi:hypothetical protein